MSTQTFSVWNTATGQRHRVTLLQPSAGSPDLAVAPDTPPGQPKMTLDDGRVLRTLGDGRYADATSGEEFSTQEPETDD